MPALPARPANREVRTVQDRYIQTRMQSLPLDNLRRTLQDAQDIARPWKLRSCFPAKGKQLLHTLHLKH